MTKKSFTPISTLGEFGLIEKLTKNIKTHNSSTQKGIGDDAAVLGPLSKSEQLISTDMLIEGVHFDPTYTPLKHLGYKSVVVNISDICAMNGQATHILVSVGIPNKYSIEHMEDLYEGIKLACKNYNIDLIGGDTTSSSTGLVISVSVFGKAKKQSITYRNGAKANDLLLVSGKLGAAYLGLQILEREKAIFKKNENSQPFLDKYEHVLEKQLKPEPRTDVVTLLKELKIKPSSMIDLSDGLSSEVLHICNSSNVGAKIFENKIPVSKESKIVSDEFKINPTICALHGGEDYELLITISQKDYEKIKGSSSLTPIGHITSDKNIYLVADSGEEINLLKDGWDSFLNKKNKNI